MIAIDTNILVYARREELGPHTRALATLTKLAEGSRLWALPVFCIGEFLRVVSHPRLFDPPTAIPAALKFIDALLQSPTARVLLPAEGYLSLLGEILGDTGVSGNLIFDAQIAALCVQSGVKQILTEDRDFTRFPDLEVVGVNQQS